MDILIGVLQYPRAQGWLAVIAAVDPQPRRVLAAMAVVLSIPLQLTWMKPEPELLLKPAADGLEYRLLRIGALET